MSSSSDSTAYWVIPLFNIILNHVEDVVELESKLAKYLILNL